MKKLKYIFCIVLASVFLNSCDLETGPNNAASDTVIYNNLENMDYMLNGAWRYLWEAYSWAACPGFYMMYLVSDLMANDMVEPRSYGTSALYRYTGLVASNNSYTSRFWTNGYYAIDNMNNILARIDDIPSTNEELRTRVKAQAYAIRGFVYTELATFYGNGYAYDPQEPCIPIYTEPSNVLTEGNSISTLQQVMKQAEDDLLEAYRLMSDSYERSHKGKANKNVIAGLLARVYQRRGEWGDARKYAEEAHAGYTWMAKEEYSGGFNSVSNAEWIWGHAQTSSQSGVTYLFHYKDTSSDWAYYRSFMADPHFMEHFDTDDVRYELFEYDLKNKKGYLMYKKFKIRSDARGDHVLMRKAEMVLIEAEAYAELGESGNAIARLNELRVARGANTPDLTALTKDELIEEILLERRKELWGEGFGLSDIKRRQKAVVREAYPDDIVVGQDKDGNEVRAKGHDQLRLPDGTAFTVNSSYYVFPIPQSEKDNNPNIN